MIIMMKKTRLRLSDEEERVRQVLIGCAQEGRTLTCTRLVQMARLTLDMAMPNDRATLGTILGDIVEYEHDEGRPMLSSVVAAGSSSSQSGFFSLAEELGVATFRNSNDRLDFSIREFERTVSYWKQLKHDRQ